MRNFCLITIAASLCMLSVAARAEIYPPSVVTLFNKNCVDSVHLPLVCSCVMDRVQQTVPLAEFTEEGSRDGGIQADPRYMSAIQFCLQKYPQNSSSTLR